jgi:hypothetical protein
MPLLQTCAAIKSTKLILFTQKYAEIKLDPDSEIKPVVAASFASSSPHARPEFPMFELNGDDARKIANFP